MKKHSGWAIHYPNCIVCKTTNFKHASRGKCESCYSKAKYLYVRRSQSRWSYTFDECVICHKTDSPHFKYGECGKCFGERKEKERLERISIQKNRSLEKIPLTFEQKLKAKEWVFINKQTNRNFIYQYLLQHPCVDCGEKDIIVLELDHVNGNKSFGISDRMTSKWTTLEKEVNKCEVVCSNCHKRRTARKQGWWKAKILEKNIKVNGNIPLPNF